MRVAFLTNVLSPYRVPLYEELAATTGWDLRVFVNANNEFDRNWNNVTTNVDVQRVRTLTLRRKVRTRKPVACEQIVELHLPYALPNSLRKFAPDVVISLELGPRSIAAATYCARNGVPLIVWSYQSRAAATMTGWLRRMARRFIMSRTKAFVGMGTQAREVLLRAGASENQIFDAPNAPDHFSIQQRLDDPAVATRAAAIRKQFHGDRILIVVGRLVPMKAAPEIVSMWRSLAANVRAGWRLVFVGDGPLAHAVHGLEHEGIHHTGHLPAEQVTDWFAAADLHLFASLVDVWGLVVSEAMQCGTPTLCSIHAGCADDVINDCVDGWLFDPTNTDSWRYRLSVLLQSDDLHEFGARARDASQRFNVARMASGFRMAVRAVAGTAAERATEAQQA